VIFSCVLLGAKGVNLMKKQTIFGAASLLTLAFAIAIAIAIAIDGGAHTANAASTNVSGNTNMTGWVNYPTVRQVSSQSRIAFTPNNLFDQNASGSLSQLSVKVVDDADPIQWSSTAHNWDQTLLNRYVLISGLAQGTSFRMAANGFRSGTDDSTWGGFLEY
jgi:hypothetical protein